LVDPHSNLILDVNDGAEKIFRRFKSDLIGSNPRDLITHIEMDSLSQMLNQLAKNEKWTDETIIEDKRGNSKWIQLSVLPFQSAGKDYRLWNIQDINSLKQTQAELETRNEDLKSLNEDLDSLVYSVAHDMRGPLATLQSLLELKVDDGSELSAPEMQKALILRMESYIQDVVNFSKNKRIEIEKSPVALKALVEGIRSELMHYEKAEEVELKINVSEGQMVMSDEYRLKVILYNLIANAINYADFNKNQAWIELNFEENDEMFRIEVKDNGQGIPEEYQEKIFQMFFRTSNDSNGSGLGLFLVKESAKKLNALVKLQSSVGEGSSFSIEFPK